jgi:hypothetical protein
MALPFIERDQSNVERINVQAAHGAIVTQIALAGKRQGVTLTSVERNRVAESVKDLPDPLEETSSAGTSSPDDLLAKMAEDAIDQLIADADNGREPAAPLTFNQSTDELGASKLSDLDLVPAPPQVESTAPQSGRRVGDVVERVAEPSRDPDRPSGAASAVVPLATPSPLEAAEAAHVDPMKGTVPASEHVEPTPSLRQPHTVEVADAGAVDAAAPAILPPAIESPAEAKTDQSLTHSEALSAGSTPVAEMPFVEPLSLTPPSHDELDAVLKAAASEAALGGSPETLEREQRAPLDEVPHPGEPSAAAATRLEPPSPASAPVIEMPPPVDVPAEIASDSRADVKALLNDAARKSSPVAAASGMLIKPLEWVNAPFAYVSDRVRDAIGQVAIITLINALGVMLYVIFFRQK